MATLCYIMGIPAKTPGPDIFINHMFSLPFFVDQDDLFWDGELSANKHAGLDMTWYDCWKASPVTIFGVFSPGSSPSGASMGVLIQQRARSRHELGKTCEVRTWGDSFQPLTWSANHALLLLGMGPPFRKKSCFPKGKPTLKFSHLSLPQGRSQKLDEVSHSKSMSIIS